MFTSIKKPLSFQETDDTNIKIVGDYDRKMLDYIGRLYKDLNGDTIDINELENIVDVLAAYKNKSERSYLDNLIHPERAKGCKIPSPIPVPSTSFQLHNSFTLSTNQLGNLAIVFNPFYLYNNNDLDIIQDPYIDTRAWTPKMFSTFFYNNSSNLTGHQATIEDNYSDWKPLNAGQGIPNVYDQYRLVSASIIVKYIGRMDITSGVLGGAIVFDENKAIGSMGAYHGNMVIIDDQELRGQWLNKYANFDLAMDSFYHQENLCLEGLRMLYFPIDNTFEEYTKLAGSSISTVTDLDAETEETPKHILRGNLNQGEDYNKSGFNWMIYALGAPPNSSCFKIDFYCNFECLPNASFLNYMPITPPCGYVSNQEKKESITIVQNKPVMKADETVIIKKDKENAWKKLKKAFSGALPSIGKLITKGLIQAIPYMKPGLALAGTMLEAATGPSTNLNMSIEDVD